MNTKDENEKVIKFIGIDGKPYSVKENEVVPCVPMPQFRDRAIIEADELLCQHL